MDFKVKMIRGAGFTDKEWAGQLEAAYWWAKCWNDKGFQDSILNLKRKVTTCSGSLWWKKCTTTEAPSRFTFTSDTNAQVLAKMLSGAETLSPEADGEADVTVIVANQRKVIGWTYPNTLIEWVSKWFLDDSTIWDEADNRAHEYLHKLGYDHASAKDYESVPYKVGYMTSDWVKANFVAGEFKLS